MSDLTECADCGAAVMNAAVHERWHGAIDAIEDLADDALQKAEYASNVLYQNNIQV